MDFNLAHLFDRLVTGVRVNTEYEFLKDYDSNHNSIFDEKEIEKIKADLERYDKVDGKRGVLSKFDLTAFCDSFAEKVKSPKELLGQVSEWLKSIEIGMNDELIDLKKQNLTTEEYGCAKEILLSDKEGRFFSDELSSIVKNITPEKLDKLKFLLNMKFAENEEILSATAIEHLLKLNDVDYQCALEIFASGDVEPSRFAGVAKLVPVLEHLPKDFFKTYPDFWVKSCLDGIGYKEYEDSSIIYLFNDDGLLEVRKTAAGSESELIINLKTKSIQTVESKEIAGQATPYTEKIEVFDSLNYDKLTGEIIKGNLVKSVTTVPSSVNGVPFITEEDASGNKNPVQYALTSEDGSVFINKSFVSPSGVKTEYTYEQTSDDLKIMHYKIVDKNQKVLLNREQTLQKLDENNFITSLNGDSYHACFSSDKLTITEKKQNLVKEFKLSKKFLTEGKEYIVEVLKNVPSNLLMVMDKLPLNGINFDENSDDGLRENNAAWTRESRSIELGFQNDIAADLSPYDKKSIEYLTALFLHEYGHYLDSCPEAADCSAISGDKELQAVFEKELDLFIKASSGKQQEFIDYFTQGSGYGAERAAQERTAEGTMLLNTQPIDAFAFRVMYFQQNFPETIAMYSKILDARIENLLTE